MRMSAGGEAVERAWECSLSDERKIAEGDFYSRLFWDGEVLVFECGSNGAESWSMSWRYELLEASRRLRAVEQMRGGGGNFDNTWIFEKR